MRIADLHLSLTLAALLGASCPATAQDEDAAPTTEQAAARVAAREWLAKVAKSLEDVRVVRAQYTQTQFLATLLRPRVTTGTLLFRRDPACLLLHVREPSEVRIRMDETSHRIYRPAEKRAERFRFERNHLTRALMSCFTSEIAKIESTFEIAALRTGEETVELDLAPRAEEARTYLKLLTLGVRIEDAAVTSITYVDAGDDRVRLDLAKIEHDPELEDPARLFDAPLPPDVRVIEHAVR